MDKAVFEYLHNIGYNKGMALERLHILKIRIIYLYDHLEKELVQFMIDDIDSAIDYLELD